METVTNRLLQTIIDAYSECPRDVATTPQNNVAPRWFYVYSNGNDIFVESGRIHINKSKVKLRALDKHNIKDVYEMYGLYKRGLMLRKEIRDKNRNSSYWFGIFEDLHL